MAGGGSVLGAALVTFAVFLVRRFTPEARGSGINEVEGLLHDLRPRRCAGAG